MALKKIEDLSMVELAFAVASLQDWSPSDRWMNTIGYIDTGEPDDEPYYPFENPKQSDNLVVELKISTAYIANTNKWVASAMTGQIEQDEDRKVAVCRAVARLLHGNEVEIPDECPESIDS